jgi:hypothetical protein
VSSAIFFALVAAVLALRLTPLWGIVVAFLAAVVGFVINGAALAASATVLFGTVGTDPGMAKLARAACYVIFGACAAGVAVLAHILSTGRAPLSRR